MKIFEKEIGYVIFESVSLILLAMTYLGCLVFLF